MKTQNRKLFYSVCVVLCIAFVFVVSTCRTGLAAEGPVLFYSDVDWGPKTGWEGSATKGAAVTIWGKNFGTTRGTNYVTVSGVQLTASSDYAEWDAIGPARGLERITFWLNSSCADGSGTISVTVGGVTSNTLPFTVMAGTIYFIAKDGSDSYNGLYSTRTGHTGSDGPFLTIAKFDPSNNPSGRTASAITYMRSGTYSGEEEMRGPYGSASARHALIGYPAEDPIYTGSVWRAADWDGDRWDGQYGPLVPISYMTLAKIHGNTGDSFSEALGDYGRFVGNTIDNYLDELWSGVIWVSSAKYVSIYGNYFNHCGYDSYKHNIYIKTQTGASNADRSTQYIYVGWNEFNNPVAGTDNRGGAIFLSRNSDVSSFPTQYIYIHDNYFHDGNMEFIYIGDNVAIGDTYIYNNIFKGGTNSNGGAISFAGGTNSVYLYNNLFYLTGAGSGVLLSGFSTGGPMTTNIRSRNNIYYATTGQLYFTLENPATFTSTNDLFYGNGAPPSGTGISVAGAVTGNPAFVSTSDFHLQSTSAARDAGTSGGTSPTVASVLTLDFDGLTRSTQGSAYDIGPYEFESGYVPPVTYTVGGTLSGMTSGTLVIRNNNSDNLSLTSTGAFTFTTALANNSSYAVTILTQPTGQTCAVTNGSGTISGANVTNIAISCSATPATYTVGGSISGLSGTVTLRNNGADSVSRSTNGAYAFTPTYANNSTYSVSVLTQPTGQTCTVSNGSGTISGANITNVNVSCTNNSPTTYTVGGSISGLSGSVSLQNNLTNTLTRSSNGSYTFTTALGNGTTYSVSVLTQPTGQTCTIANGSGTISGANITNVNITCTTNAPSTYTVGGSISGLSGSVSLRNNGTNTLTRSSNGAYTFTTALANDATYAVTVYTQPTGQTCTVANGSGTISGANVTNVNVTCANNSPTTYTIGGTITGLSGSISIQNNGANTLTRSSNGSFTFTLAQSNLTSYSVTVLSQPAGQTCTVSNGSGTISGANITNVSIACATTSNPPAQSKVPAAVRGLTVQ